MYMGATYHRSTPDAASGTHDATGPGTHDATGPGTHDATGPGTHDATGPGTHDTAAPVPRRTQRRTWGWPVSHSALPQPVRLVWQHQCAL